MTRQGSHPPKAAVWLIQHVCPGNGKEALIGDLIEGFSESGSKAWFWRQVLIAIAIGTAREHRNNWLPVCHAIAGTALLGLVGKAMARHPVRVQLWVWSRGQQWPLSNADDLARAAALALAVLPVLAALLFFRRAFNSISLLRAFVISFSLIAIGDWITFLWMSGRPPDTTLQTVILTVFGISRVLLALFLSAWLGCRVTQTTRRTTQPVCGRIRE